MAYACQIEILETSPRLMLTFTVETALPLDALLRQMPATVITDMLNELSVWVNVVGLYLILLLHNLESV